MDKALITLLLLVGSCSAQIMRAAVISSASAPVVVEAQSGVLPNTVSGVLTLTWGTSTIAGETIVVACDNVNNNNFPAGAVTDSASQSYTVLWNNVSIGGVSRGYAAYKLSSASGVTTVSITESASQGRGACYAWHARNLTGVVDVNAPLTTLSAGTPWTSPTVSTTAASEVAFGLNVGLFVSANCFSFALTGSWISDGAKTGNTFDSNNGGAIIGGHQVLSATDASFAFTGTDVAGCNHYPGVATFK